MMKISAINDEITDSFDKQLEILATNNIKYIELRKINGKLLETYDYNELLEIKRKIYKFQIKVSLIDTPIGKHEVSNLEKYFKITQLFKCKYMRIFNSSNLRYLNDLAKKYDVYLLLENEQGIEPENILEIDKQITKYEKIRLLLDIENLFSSGYEIIPNINRCIKNVYYIHLRNIKDNKFVGLKEGSINYSSIFEYLNDKKYEGFISAEFHFRLNNDNSDFTTKFINQIKELRENVTEQE